MRRLAPLDRVTLLLLGSLWLIFFLLHTENVLKGRLAGPDVTVTAPAQPDGYPWVRSLRVGGAAEWAGLEPGDVLLQIGDSDLRGMGPVRFFAHALAAMEPDQRARVVRVRSGETKEVWLSFTPFPLPVRFYVISLSFSLTAVLILFRAPRSRQASAAFRALLMFSMGFLRPWGGPVEQTYAWTAIVLTVSALFAPLVILAVQALGDETDFDPRRGRIWPWFFAPVGPIFFGWIVGLRLFGDASNLAGPISWSLLNLLGVAVLLVLAQSYRRCGPIGRRKIKWVVYSFYVSLVPVLVATTIAIIHTELWWIASASEIFEVFIPIGVFIAIVRFNLMDIDRLISATATYTVLIFGAAVGGLMVIPVLAHAASDAIGIDPFSSRLLMSIALVGAAVPCHRVLHPRIDQWFFPERQALAGRIQGLLEDLTLVDTPTELASLASARIDALLRPESCATYVRTPRGYAPVFARGRAVPPVFDERNPVIGVLQARGEPLAAEQWSKQRSDGNITAFDKAALETLGAAVLVPIRRGNELLAFTCLGPKRSGDIYTGTDLALLCAVADKVAAQLVHFDDTELIQQSRKMQEALRGYVPGVVAETLESGGTLDAGECEVAVFFVDIRGYTSFSEGREASEIFSVVDRYTGTVSRIVRQHAGSVVEFNGDGMMAVFGAPNELAHKERAAVEAGLETVAAVESLALESGDARATPLSVGVGVATGTAFVGNVRAVDRKIWSALGNVVNLAARLEALTRDFEAKIVIDRTTFERVGEAATGFIGPRHVPIRGLGDSVDVYLLPLGETPDSGPKREETLA